MADADTSKKPVTDEIASASELDIFQGFLSQIANPDKVLALECGGDISVYDDIGRDSRISSNLGTRARAVVGKEWEIVPFSQEKVDLKVAEYVKAVLLGFPFDRARRSLLRGGTLKGFSVAEIMWDVSEGDTFIADLRYRHQRRFLFGRDGHLLLKTLENPQGMDVTVRDGVELRKFQTVTFGDEVETPYGIGLGRELYWPWWFKKNGLKFWLLFCDKFAGPTAVGEYESGTPRDKQMELLGAAQAIHSNSAIVIPKGMMLRLIETARSGNVTSYTELVHYLNDEITIAILGQTATTTGTPGKLGNEQAQENVKDDLVKADADSECEAYNARSGGMIRWLVDYQFPGLGRYPQIWVQTAPPEDLKTLAERDEKISNAMTQGGFRLGRNYYIRRYGMQEDEVEAVPKPTGAGGPAFAEGDLSAEASAQADAVDELVNDELADWQPLMNPLLDPLRALVNEAIEKGWSLERLRDQLATLFDKMDSSALTAHLAAALLKARGMGDATDEV